MNFSHGMSYPISGNVGEYRSEGYEDIPLIVSKTLFTESPLIYKGCYLALAVNMYDGMRHLVKEPSHHDVLINIV